MLVFTICMKQFLILLAQLLLNKLFCSIAVSCRLSFALVRSANHSTLDKSTLSGNPLCTVDI